MVARKRDKRKDERVRERQGEGGKERGGEGARGRKRMPKIINALN
jgi:hypothetical protein